MAPRHFATLKGVISDTTLSAIIGQPLNLETMTPVQEEVLSLLPTLSEPPDPKTPSVHDLLVRAKTGTGKTLTFWFPLSKLVSKLSRHARETVGALIISPTRELATQIANEAIRPMHHSGMEVRLFTWMQGRRDIVAATTSRLCDSMGSEPKVLKSIATTSTVCIYVFRMLSPY